LAAITLLGLAAFVLFFDYPDYLRGWMEEEASRILDTPVTIDSIEVDIPNYAFVVRGVRVEPRTEGPAPLTIDSVRGELSPTGIFDRLLHLRSLYVEGLSLRVDDYGGGRIELPGRWGNRDGAVSTEAGPQFGFLADRIRFDGANFVYDNHNIPWRLEAEGLAASLERTGADRFQGRVRYERGVVRVKERESIDAGVETQFELAGREIRVEELAAHGDFYRLVSRGRVTLGAQPEADFALHIESDVGPAARDLLGLTLLESEPGAQRNPQATFEGSLLMGRGWHLVRGEASVPRARFAGMPLRGFRAQVLWDRNVVELRSTEGFLGGGATAVNFRQAIPWTAEPAEIELSFENVLLSQAIESVSLAGERFGSRISGNVKVAFPLNDPLLATGRFSLRGVAEKGPDLSGLDFSLAGNLDQGELRLEPSRLQADDVVVTASGLYPRTGSASVSFAAEAGDLSRADRLQQSLRTLLHPERPARTFGISGSGRARGRLVGRLPSLVFEGDANGHNVLFRSISWGDVEASGTLSRELVHFTSLRSQNAEGMLRGRGTFALESQDSPAAAAAPPSRGILGRNFELDVELEHWPASILDPVLGLSIDVGGLLTGSGKFSSRQGVLSGTGNVSVTGGTFQGRSFDVVSSHVAIQSRQLLLDDLTVSREAAQVRGTLSLHLETLAIAGALRGTRVPIGLMGVVPSDVAGELQGTLRLGGRLPAPTADLEADVVGLRVAGWDLGQGRVDAELRDKELRGDFSVSGSGIDLEADLGIELSQPMALAGRARWSRADLAPLLRSTLSLTGPELPGSLRLVSAGEASFAGEVGSVENLSASVRLSSLTVEVADYHLASSEPIDFGLEGGELQLKSLVLVGDDTRLRIGGGANLVNGEMDLDAEGAVNLAAFHAVFPSMSWSGNADLAGRLHGEWARPELSGSIDLRGGAVSFRSFPQAIGDINGRILFDNRTVRLSGIEGRFGGAPVALTGSLSLNRLSPESFDLSASGRGMRLRYPEGLVAEADAELRLTGTDEAQVLSGQIDVHEATWSREYDVAAGILGSRDVLDFTEGPEEPAFPDLRLDIRVNIPENFRVRNSLAVIDGQAELQVRGTLDRPALLGRAEAVRGEVFLLGQRYDVLSGKVEFIDPNSIRPFFDLTAETRVRSYRVEFRLAGTPDRFFPELSSDPPLRTVEILRLLAGATERELRLGTEEEEVAGVGVASLLTERLNQELSRRAERLFGLDRISIDPFLVGQFSNPTARVSVGKQISSDLAINYSTAFGETTESIVVVIEYTPEGPITYTISRDETGALAVDMKFRKSF
jgi:hypothetical protein